MRTKLLTLLAIASIATFFACKKDKATDTPTCVAGTGGTKTIVAFLEHHGQNIPNHASNPDTVWAKLNANDWSNAPAGYDLQFIGEAGENHVHMEGLKCGTYFLYASGLDTTISLTVKGGLKVEVLSTDNEVDTHIPVTE